MAIPIIKDWKKYFSNPHEGLGSSYERIILNKLLYIVVDKYVIHNALETPSFGFTGISGINLMGLAKKRIEITLEDHDEERLELISKLWNKQEMQLTTNLNTDYKALDYPENSFDLGFNFSALWFVTDLKLYLSELCRVCSKAILICVPNRSGIGYKMQIKDYNPDKYPMLKPEYIDPLTIKTLMKKNGWKLQAENFIDCPPWPDIGMTKELFIGKLFGSSQMESQAEKTSTTSQVSILPYYQGNDAGFENRMLRYSLVERLAPKCFKRIWAHHYYLLFTPSGD